LDVLCTKKSAKVSASETEMPEVEPGKGEDNLEVNMYRVLTVNSGFRAEISLS